MKHKIKLLDILMISILIGSILVFLYPFVQNQLNTFLDQKVINHYQEKANKENKNDREKIIKEQEKKNNALAKEKSSPGLKAFNQAVEEEKDSKKVPLDYYNQHTLGVLYIPSIKVKLPIFDQTNDTLLQKGASLLEGSSYPSKEGSIHSVLSAHRGLPEAKLFTDLPKMTIGDTFFIEINGETLAYEVIETTVVEPTETDSLTIKDGQNLVTLLTCTPYMINTHRLLVTGKQVPYVAEKNDQEIQSISKWESIHLIILILGILAIVLLTALVLATWIKRKMISNRLYSLHLEFLNKKKKPLQNEKILLIPNSKKKKPISLTLDPLGRVKHSDIPGGKYSLKVVTGKYQKAQPIQLSIKKVKATHFTVAAKNKKQNYQITIQEIKGKTRLTYKKNRTNKKKKVPKAN